MYRTPVSLVFYYLTAPSLMILKMPLVRDVVDFPIESSYRDKRSHKDDVSQAVESAKGAHSSPPAILSLLRIPPSNDVIPQSPMHTKSLANLKHQEYPAKIHVRSKLHYFPLIKDRLNEARRSLFLITCFGSWFDITYVEKDDVTGIKFGMVSFREYRNGDIPFRNRLFPEKIGNDVKIINVLALIEDEEKLRSVTRAAKHKDNGEFHPGLSGRHKGREAALIDHVHDLEGLCESLLTLPKEVITLKTNRIEKEESFNKFGPQIEDLLKRTSKDEPDIKDNTSKIVEKDVGDVYCCDVNGHVPGVFMPANPVSQPIQDQIIRLANQRQQDDISKMAEEDEHKIKSEIQSLYDHREARLNKIAKEEKQRKFLGHMNSSAHMKLAIEHCVPKKRNMEQLANQKNILNPLMIEKCKFVKPWIEDLKRPFNRIDRIFLSHDLKECFWHGLCGLDGNRKGWLVDEVFIPINEPKRHWSLAMFHICSGIVTFYDSEKTNATHDKKFRPWHADHVPKQGGLFGDCGVFLCMFLYRLAYGVPLVVDDPVQAALADREKMIRFYFQHKMFCP
ncbi:phospholipase-like protein [Tanacetum coccineum]